MLEVYRVVASFSAEQLRRVHQQSETFEVGELLVVLTSDGTHTVFSSYEEAKDLSSRSRFVVAAEVFKQYTEASEQGASPSKRD